MAVAYGEAADAGQVSGSIGLTLFAMIGIPFWFRELPKVVFNSAQAQEPKAPDAKTPDAKTPDAKTADTKTAPTTPATPPTATATPAPAPDPYTTVKPGDIVNPVNTTWTLVAAFLVFGMQVGFTMASKRASVARVKPWNVLMECIVDTCLCGILFYAFGYAFMFSHGNGFIGYHWFFLQDAPTTYESTGVAFLAHWISSTSRLPTPARRSPPGP